MLFRSAIDGGLLLDIEGDSAETGAEPTIQTIHITMADMGNETDFNADSEDLLMLDSSTVFLEVSAGASESDVGHFYNGSVTLLGDEDNSIDLTGGVVDAADLATAGRERGISWYSACPRWWLFEGINWRARWLGLHRGGE